MLWLFVVLPSTYLQFVLYFVSRVVMMGVFNGLVGVYWVLKRRFDQREI